MATKRSRARRYRPPPPPTDLAMRWQVLFSYQGFNQAVDRRVSRAVGRRARFDGSGYAFGDSRRDCAWQFTSAADAAAAAARVAVLLPALASARLRPTLECVSFAGPQPAGRVKHGPVIFNAAEARKNGWPAWAIERVADRLALLVDFGETRARFQRLHAPRRRRPGHRPRGRFRRKPERPT